MDAECAAKGDSDDGEKLTRTAVDGELGRTAVDGLSRTAVDGELTRTAVGSGDDRCVTVRTTNGDVLVDPGKLLVSLGEREPPHALFRLLGLGEGFAQSECDVIDLRHYNVGHAQMLDIINFIRTGNLPKEDGATHNLTRAFNALGGWDELDAKLVKSEQQGTIDKEARRMNPMCPEDDTLNLFEWRTMLLGMTLAPGHSCTATVGSDGRYVWTRKRREGQAGNYATQQMHQMTAVREALNGIENQEDY